MLCTVSMTIEAISMMVGLLAASVMLVKLVWSIAMQAIRLWPPEKSTRLRLLWRVDPVDRTLSILSD